MPFYQLFELIIDEGSVESMFRDFEDGRTTYAIRFEYELFNIQNSTVAKINNLGFSMIKTV